MKSQAMKNAALRGKPGAGNPRIRFDEGEVAPTATPRCGSLLDRNITDALRRAVSLCGCLVASFLALALAALSPSDAYAGTLPRGTKFVEYIESSGTQWINTGFSPSNANVRIEVTYQFATLPAVGTLRYIFGSCFQVNQTNYDCIRFQYAVGSAGNCFIGFGNTYKDGLTFDSYDTNTVHTVVCDGGVFSLDGTTSNAWDLSETTFAQTDSAHPVYLFGRNVNYSEERLLSSIRLYSCKIWDQGVLIRDFIPAVTNDTFGCLYDKVDGRFYGNAGYGGFADIGDEIPMKYRNLAYIESYRTAYINTKYVPNSKTDIEMAFSFLYPLKTRAYLFGVYGSDDGGRLQFCYGPAAVGCFLGYGSNYQSGVTGIPYNTARHVARYVPGEGFYFDGTLVTTASVDLKTWDGTSANLFLGANNRNGGPMDTSSNAPIRIYSCKIREDGVPVRDFVPVQRKFDGKNGLLDKVTGEFYAYYGPNTDYAAGELSGFMVFVR